ncbi:glycoside hydrolase family 2 TIM barrel-domain containing protein [Pontibacter silvestris]|uniref:Glycoside hydrolase family 2 TIM barrel-domain containing protein n=1 Tax=Pontibacter silvestris TaxID=2305183 RepID=A0ABW4WSP9_9BACT|nr:glycoside hydrolase family 2 TIM barrel-domain containing protein [Pontibacter silvestris]MCC9138404.1 glycosyl hydrolase [Pontibacter silvestris]
MMPKVLVLLFLILSPVYSLFALDKYELNSGWKCIPITKVDKNGQAISQPTYSLSGWAPAVVPGTVLTTQLENKQIPDPFYGMNNKKIPDIYHTGSDYYTYWFAKDFKETLPQEDEQVWLHLRGVNYSCEVFLNGQKLNKETHYGMFLRQTYNITPYLAKDGDNRLAVIVYPPDPVGNPNGGQAGDGTIAKNVSHQYVAGWDWIQPIRDRNTGIWDKVIIEKTKQVNLKNPHVVTLVPGVRKPEGPQQPAIIKVSAELENPTSKKVNGVLRYTLDGHAVSQKVSIPAHSTQQISLKNLTLQNPKLWWPNGYGPQHLYQLKLQFLVNGNAVSDEENVQVGIREIQTEWNERTQSKQVNVNGQKIFIKGGNWIISDAMLRFTDARYDAEVRFHRDMNLNLIRVWGGALVERPEFYQACDKYGLLVIQDFWMSGDANGRWVDPMKLEDQWTRRKYPDDHQLFIKSAADQVKMIRNYASLAMWCGGNEITPPKDIITALQDSILPELDGTRWFIPYSNADSMSYNTIGGNGDGPYTIQPFSKFWSFKTYPFNSEVGSVGVGDYESLERFIPEENMVAPQYMGSESNPSEKVDSVWTYHTYTGVGYEQHILPYGAPTDVKDFATKAQLVNYNQYRALIEGFSSHMWDWYTGTIIWKTQNPWTAMRGQMYDYYLDPNASLYGLRTGSKPLHIMYNPVDSMVMMTNNTFDVKRDMMMVVDAYDMSGKKTALGQVIVEINPSMSKKYLPINASVQELAKDKGAFLSLRLLDLNKQVIDDNFYWLPNAQGEYNGLKELAKVSPKVEAQQVAKGKIEVTVTNPATNTVAFFNRLSLVNSQTQERLLPVFYSDNYVSVLPGEHKTITMEYTPGSDDSLPAVTIEGWNVEKQTMTIK